MKLKPEDISPARALELMFAGLMPSRSTNDVELVAAAFIASIDGISALAICETAIAFMKGEVKDHKRGYVPNSAEFAEEARKNERLGRIMGQQLEGKAEQLAQMQRDNPELHAKAVRWIDNNRKALTAPKGEAA